MFFSRVSFLPLRLVPMYFVHVYIYIYTYIYIHNIYIYVWNSIIYNMTLPISSGDKFSHFRATLIGCHRPSSFPFHEEFQKGYCALHRVRGKTSLCFSWEPQRRSESMLGRAICIHWCVLILFYVERKGCDANLWLPVSAVNFYCARLF